MDKPPLWEPANEAITVTKTAKSVDYKAIIISGKTKKLEGKKNLYFLGASCTTATHRCDITV